jgi:hypothetical protein
MTKSFRTLFLKSFKNFQRKILITNHDYVQKSWKMEVRLCPELRDERIHKMRLMSSAARPRVYIHGTLPGLSLSPPNITILRSSPRQKWWSSNMSEEFLVENSSHRSVAVQTEGYLLPYPPNSSWLKKNNESISEINQESHSTKQEASNEVLEKSSDFLEERNNLLENMIQGSASKEKLQSSILIGDPLAKKRPTHRSYKSQLGTSLTGKGRLAKKVYVESNSFLRDDDISSQESSLHQDHISINGRSINNRPIKSRTQPRKTDQKLSREEANNSDPGMDDNTIISNITISPR